MQYHWRLYTYVVALLVAAAIVLLSGLTGQTLRRATVVFAAIACMELLAGGIQVARPADNIPDLVRSEEIDSLVDLDPSPVLRNDATMLRAEGLPILDQSVPLGTVAHPGSQNPERRLIVRPPGGSRRFAVPSTAAPPFVVLSPGYRPVAWAPTPQDPNLDDFGRQLWLVVEGPAVPDLVGGDRLLIRPSNSGTVSFARTMAGPLNYLLLVGLVVTTAIALFRSVRSRPTAFSAQEVP